MKCEWCGKVEEAEDQLTLTEAARANRWWYYTKYFDPRLRVVTPLLACSTHCALQYDDWRRGKRPPLQP